jgi:RimJ/RimL family protein N-acetyltransferase
MASIRLRQITADDVPLFFAQQSDAEARRMVAFCDAGPGDLAAFVAKWQKIMADPVFQGRTIEVDSVVAGNIGLFTQFDLPSIGYWLGREYWGRGIATQAVAAFVAELGQRPLYARVATDNIGSRRALERNGFRVIGTEHDFAPARGEEAAEFVLELLPVAKS